METLYQEVHFLSDSVGTCTFLLSITTDACKSDPSQITRHCTSQHIPVTQTPHPLYLAAHTHTYTHTSYSYPSQSTCHCSSLHIL